MAATKTPKKPDDGSDGCDSDDSDGDLVAEALVAFLGALADKRAKKSKGKPGFPKRQVGLKLPSAAGTYPFTWEEMTTDLAGIGFAFGDVVLRKPNVLCRAVAYEVDEDRLWTTCEHSKNCVACYTDFSERKAEFEKYAPPTE